jgi:hypothetical protein
LGLAALFCLVCLACRRRDQVVVRQHDNGYFSTERRVAPGVARRTLWHTVGGKPEQVTELIVVSNNIVTFMPTILQEGGCIRRFPDIRAEIKGWFALGYAGGDGHPITFGIGSDESTVKQISGKHAEKAMTLAEFSNSVGRLKQYTTATYSVLELGTPCPLQLFDEIITGLCQFSGGGISVVPAVRHIPVYVPYHPDDSPDIKVDVRGL